MERIVENGYNLDIKNPNGKEDFEHLPPEQLVEDIVKKEQRILEIMAEVRQALAGGTVSKTQCTTNHPRIIATQCVTN